MKPLILILSLLLAAAPFQAHACGSAMPGEDGPPAGMSIDSGDGHGSGAHDCCADDPPAEPADCDVSGACDHCLAGASALPVQAYPAVLAPAACRCRLVSGALAPSHSTPPFRPPAVLS